MQVVAVRPGKLVRRKVHFEFLGSLLCALLLVLWVLFVFLNSNDDYTKHIDYSQY